MSTTWDPTSLEMLLGGVHQPRSHSNLVGSVVGGGARRNLRCAKDLRSLSGNGRRHSVITRGAISSQVLALPATRGDLLILASTVNWAIYTILGRDTLKRLGSSRATSWMMLVGSAMLLPFFVKDAGWQEYTALSPTTIGAVIFLGIGCSGLGYLFWYAALERIETSKVAAFLYLEPLITLGAAVTLLGEPVAASTLIGGGLVLVGVFTVQQA